MPSVAAKPKVVVTAPPTKAQTIKRLLARAEKALARDRLLSPASGNAYDYYASVLLLDPANKSASLGLQAIVLRYVGLARSAAQESHFKEANIYLDRALSIDPNNQKVQTLVQGLREDAAPLQVQTTIAENAVLLDQRLLTKRSTRVIEQLGLLAIQIKRDNSTLVIVARNDAEGRWIYQQMREAVPGYLLRGDIQIGTPARVELQAPMQ